MTSHQINRLAVDIKGMLAKMFVFLGDLSYPLYLFHLPAFLFAYAALGIRKPEILFAAALMISLFFLLVVERYIKPRFLKRVFLG